MRKARKDPSWKGTPHSKVGRQRISSSLKELCKRPEIREQKRLAGIMSVHSQRGRISKFEINIKNILKDVFKGHKLIHKLIHQFTYPLGVADFFIPTVNLIIFADGEYWHSLKGAKERDLRQSKYLRNQGYRVWRISDQTKDFSKFKNNLRKLLKVKSATTFV